jgi:hypothetical protein
MRWHAAAAFGLQIFQPHPRQSYRRQSYRPFWRMVALILP